jgi:hypothetical protein
MPINKWLPDKPLRVAQNNVTLVGANSDSPRATIWTVPLGRKFTLYAVGTDQASASVDLLAFHITGPQSVQLLDRQTNTLPTDERLVPMFEEFKAGDSLTVGIRNRTGAGITPNLYVFYSDEPAA